jgi:hypothetical protein
MPPYLLFGVGVLVFGFGLKYHPGFGVFGFFFGL